MALGESGGRAACAASGERVSGRCSYRCKPDPIPPSMTLDVARHHPGFKHLLEPGAQCELDAGHGRGTDEQDVARRHRNGGLLWWDPVIFATGYDPEPEL